MPAFGPTHTDEELWAIVSFLQELEAMTQEEYARWEERFAPVPGDTAAAAGSGHSHEPGTADHSH